MAKIEITKTELVWPGKYNEDGTLKEVPRVSLPFQVIETVNDSRATREAKKGGVQQTLFDVWEGKEGDTFEAGWRNKLIWGDNLLVMGSLLEKFAGKIDLIYIDPPFATGADFSFTAPIGEEGEEVYKEQSVIEEKAYRDTWGTGLISYCGMMNERLSLARELLSEDGVIFVHIGSDIEGHVRLLLEDVFGADCFKNAILVRRGRKNLQGQFAVVDSLMRDYDVVLLFSKSGQRRFPKLTCPLEDIREGTWNNHWRGTDRPTMRYSLFGITPERGQWRWSQERSIAAIKNYQEFQKVRHRYKSIDDYWREHLERTGQRLDFLRLSATGKPEHYVPPAENALLGDVWFDVPAYARQFGYATEKSEELLERVILWSSEPGDLVADFFCGSGTTLAVAEKLGRRWIGCDLGRWAIHVTRKRLLGIENCKPFEILNLGKYERQYWQGVTFAPQRHVHHRDTESTEAEKENTLSPPCLCGESEEQRIYEYLAFILKLYGAQPVTGMAHLHGKKGKAMIHIGAVDAPVTIDEVNQALDECVAVKQTELHVLGWEWEMGLAGPNNDVRKGSPMHEIAKQKGVKLLLLQIPREVMEQQAADKGDVRFFELAYFEAKINQPKKLTVQIELRDFATPNADLIPEDVRSKIKKWSDYIDYWAIDWNFQNDTFMQGWVAYRTRKERKLPLVSDPHTYEKPGKYRILVKVIDIFGNDTSQSFDVEVK